VYVFRLMSLEVADGKPFYSTLSGRITVVRTLKGGAPKASGVTYSIGCCNPKLSVGDYYLAAVSNDATVLELVPGDQSVIIVSDDFEAKGGAGKKGVRRHRTRAGPSCRPAAACGFPRRVPA